MNKSAWLCGAVALMAVSAGLADSGESWYIGGGINQTMPLKYDDGNGNTYDNKFKDYGWQAIVGKTVNSWLAVETSVDAYHDRTTGDPSYATNYESLSNQTAVDIDGLFSKRILTSNWATFQGFLKAGFSYIRLDVTTNTEPNGGSVATWVEVVGGGLSMTVNSMPDCALRWSVRSYLDGVRFQDVALSRQTDMQLSLIYSV